MIKDTNPDHYKVDGANFIEYMNDPKISVFGNWMFANGYSSGVLASTNWISVKDRLPEENEAVNIVWMNTEPESYYEHIKGKPFVATGVYFRSKWYWWSSVVQDYLAEYGSCEPYEMDEAIVVTHWMPMPPLPPKEES